MHAEQERAQRRERVEAALCPLLTELRIRSRGQGRILAAVVELIEEEYEQ
jgi:hypothetical protein